MELVKPSGERNFTTDRYANTDKSSPDYVPFEDHTGRRRYYVTLKKGVDFQDFYDDMETPGGALYIPDRAIDVSDRRPISRSTGYELTKEEAETVANDDRVLAVELDPILRGLKPGLNNISQTGNFVRDGVQTGSDLNWGMLEHLSNTKILGGFGVWANSTLRNGQGSSDPVYPGSYFSEKSDTIQLNATGKNVDVVIVDDNGTMVDHPEFAVNSDGTGGSRVVQYNWYQWNPQVTGGSAGNYSWFENSSSKYHGVHCSGTVAGNTQGWARDSNIYPIEYYAGGNVNYTFPYVMDYVRQFHNNKSINPSTGRKNPTVCNQSWGWSLFYSNASSPSVPNYNESTIQSINYRGTTINSTANPSDGGTSGVYNTGSTPLATFTPADNSAFTIRTTAQGTASVTPLESQSITSTSGLTASTTPTFNTQDDGYWELSLDWNLNYLGTDYQTVYLGTNSYFTLTNGSTYYGSTPSSINLPKLLVSARDNSAQRIYYGTTGSAPNRVGHFIFEGNNATTGTLGSPTMRYELKIYENDTSRIDLIVESNSRVTTGFSSNDLKQYGFMAGSRIPQRVAALDADMEDCFDDGIISVSSAGNGKAYHATPGDQDWNNYVTIAGQNYYYMRGSSPSAVDTVAVGGVDLPNIAVGAIDHGVRDGKPVKVEFSDCGPAVEIYAAGHNIQSAWPSTTVSPSSGSTDPRNGSYKLAKISGTSMSGPQVAGCVACMMEVYPYFKQEQVKAHLLKNWSQRRLMAGETSDFINPYIDTEFLNGSSPTNYLYYNRERPFDGPMWPKKNHATRGESGILYPRNKKRDR